MHQSPTYAGRKNQNVFVEMSIQSAETGRLLHEARHAEVVQPSVQATSFARRLHCLWVEFVQRMQRRRAPYVGEAGC